MIVLATTGMMPPQDAARFDRAHRDLVADRAVQFDMAPFVPPKPPSWLDDLIAILASDAARVIFWILIGLAVLALVALIANRLWGVPLPWKWRRRKAEEAEPISWQPEAAPARALLREADALAQQGRYDEAAHLLLFRSIEDIESRRPRLVRPALTSRDIAGAPEIPGPARTAFNAIVMMVERSLFGGRRLAETDWRECRTAYENFAFAESWR